MTTGNRVTLTANELDLLETKILPTARRWLGVYSLRQHGIQTLRHWGEEAPEETGKETTR